MEPNRVDIEKIIQKNNKVYVSLAGCTEDTLNKMARACFPYMQDYPGSFCVFRAELEKVHGPVRATVDLLVSRGLIGIAGGDGGVDEVFSACAGIGKKRMLLVVHDMNALNEFLAAGKKAGIFPAFCVVNEDGSIGKLSPPAKKPEVTEKPYVPTAAPRQTEVNRTTAEEKPYAGSITADVKTWVGSTVFDEEGREYRILEKVLSNNGAATYKTDGKWVKLYDEDLLCDFIEEKVRLMVKEPVSVNGICWPLSIAVDENKTFRGYFMDEAAGEPIHLCVMKRAGIEKYFPHWDKKSLCTLTITILDKIDRLHQKGILMGCINPAAIRVVDEKTVYFTDTDNYQVGGYPSYVYNNSFTPPELIGKKNYMIDEDSENFAVAELVFMIMMTGKTPYAVGAAGDRVAEIRRMEFPFPCGKIHGDAALPGMWRFMWSHLTPFKKPFYETFQKNGDYNMKGSRRRTGYWIHVTKDFKKDLEHPKDRESLKIYPGTFKRGREDTFYKCNYCGVEHPRFYFNDRFFNEYRICNGCIGQKSDVSFTCVDCGKTYYYTNKTALFHKQMKKKDSEWKDQKHCRDCKQKTATCKSCGKEVPYYLLDRKEMCPDCHEAYRNMVYKKIRCKDCGKIFDFTNGDYEFYKKRGFGLPTRCPDCRDKKKRGKW